MEIPFNRKQRTTRKTDLTGLRMRNGLIGSLTARLLDMNPMEENGATPKERVEDWLALYRSLPESATLEQLQECWRQCPAPYLPEAQRLLIRLVHTRMQALAARKPSP